MVFESRELDGLEVRFETENHVFAARMKQMVVMNNQMLLPKAVIRPSAVQKARRVLDTSA